MLCWPRSWALWAQPRREVVYALAVEAVAAVAVGVAVWRHPPVSGQDWAMAGLLSVGATVYLVGTRRQEERRRADRGYNRVLIDLGGVWSVAAIMLLPTMLVVGVILVLRLQRWFVARRPAYRFGHSTASILLAATLCRAVLDWAGPPTWSNPPLAHIALVCAVGALYSLVQAAVVGLAIVLASPTRPTWGMAMGTRRDNLEAALGTGVGLLTALTAKTAPVFVVLIAVLLVALARILRDNEELRQDALDSRRDHKTGVLNPQGWTEQTQRVLRRARPDTPIALLALDLDHFKRVNDTWGHPAGDAVLRVVGAVLQSLTRLDDIAARDGGEEFLVLCPNTTASEAVEVAERIRAAIATVQVQTTDKRGQEISLWGRQAQHDEDGNPIPSRQRVLSASIGVVALTGREATLRRLHQHADAALYTAKDNGRNRVEVASPAAPVVPAQTAVAAPVYAARRS